MATTTGDTIDGSFGELDFTGLPYRSGTVASYDSSTGVLTVTTGNNYESLTLKNPGTSSFPVTSDGRNGTAVTGIGTNNVEIAGPPAGPSTASPTDNVVHISLSNDQLTASVPFGSTAVLTGSTDADFTTGTGRGLFTLTSNGQTETFTNPSVTYLSKFNATYLIAHGDKNPYDVLSINFTGQQPNGNVAVLASINASQASLSGTSFAQQAPASSIPVCFTTGTLIRVARGGVEADVAVEALAVGDLAVTACGAHRPIRWIGHRTIQHPALAQHPVRIRADAFGPGLPRRDLFLSPGHPVLVGADADCEGGHLVPVMCLINGTTIERMKVASVTYWHVELDSHDILLAEGLPAESYLDWGDRAFFSDAAAHALANPDFVVPGLAGRCRPVAIDGPIVEAERRRLDQHFAAALAAQCGWDEDLTNMLLL